MTLFDALGPYDSAPTRLPNGRPASDAPDGDREYATGLATANANLLLQALADAGVDLFAFDQAVVAQLTASLGSASIRTLVGWIVRAHLAGLARGTADATATSLALTTQSLGPFLDALLRVALGNQATGATKVATAITARSNTLSNTWTNR